MRDFEMPGRSPVMARNGMVAASHPLAALTAIDVLKSGGNALDAAVAACAVQGVVEPQSTGIGGDCFALISPDGSNRIIAFDGSGRAPHAATAAWYADQDIRVISRLSPHAVTIPGAVDAWARLLTLYGTRSLGELLRPAIEYAREGYAVSPCIARDWAIEEPSLRIDPDTTRIFLPGDRPPPAGAVHRQPELAETLAAIAEHGPDAFYKGVVADDIVSMLQSKGGLHTLADFAAVHGTVEQPIASAFREHEIYECPPPGQGVIALMILKILAGFPADGDPLGADRLHREIEATRLAYSIRDAVLADPAQSDVRVKWLLSDELATQLRQRIDLRCKMSELPTFLPPEHKDTVYVSVVDRNRMAVSFINSLFDHFGSCLVGPRSGVVLHSRGRSFVLDPGHRNVIAPGKRPMHTIIPGMAARDGRIRLSFGVVGGHYQAMGHAHFLAKLLDYGLDMQSAMDLPRVFPRLESDEIEAESALPATTRAELERRGFRFVHPDWPIGGAQAVAIDWETGVLIGASDHRKDGLALGY
jgi:gamma-glutamyltranspeptidase/glutathione hydrolase